MNNTKTKHRDLDAIKDEKQKDAEELYEKAGLLDECQNEYFGLHTFLEEEEETEKSYEMIWTRLSNSSSLFHTIN